jgi:hypothetical protein
MKLAPYLALIVGAVSMIFGIICKFIEGPILNVSSFGFILFVFACLFASIAFSLIQISNPKQG